MAIEVRNVRKTKSRHEILHNISLYVPDGALTALLGPSGSGKSTLLRIIAGLDAPDQGDVIIDGVNVTQIPIQKRGVGFVSQSYSPFMHMTVWKNVAFALEIRRKPHLEVQTRVAELLELMKLTELRDRYPAQLSGGQRQRMALARALAAEPRILLLDEPFGALDARIRQDLRTWLRELHDDVHITTLLVTHDQDEALAISDRVAVINAGAIEQVGTPWEIYEEPETPFVMNFIGSIARIGERWVRPHHLEVYAHPAQDTLEAIIRRISYLGYAANLDLMLANGDTVTAQMDIDTLQEGEFTPNQFVYVRLRSDKVLELSV